MSRIDELNKLIGDNIALKPLIEQMIELEERLAEVKGLPFIKVHPSDPTRQKLTPAHKAYREYLMQYVNVVRVLMRATGTDEADEESPLRKWMNEHIS